MKVKNYVMSVMFLMIVGTLSLNAGQPIRGESYTEFGDYSIVLSDTPMVINGKELITYDLKYSNVNDVIKIGIDETKRCKNFIVKHPGFEIEYVCTKKSFGVSMMDPEYSSIALETVNAIMDNNQFKYQERILSEQQPTDELLQLIASYFPQLILKDVRNLIKT